MTFLLVALLSAGAALAVPSSAEIAMRYALNSISNGTDSTTITNLPPLERADLPLMDPQLIAGETYFIGSTKVIFALPQEGEKLLYTTDGSPAEGGQEYKGALTITDTTRVRAVRLLKDGRVSPEFNTVFNQVGLRNGNFEEGDEFPEYWGPGGGAVARYEKGAGLGGSRCISLESKDLTSACWTQKIKVKPFTPYVLKGSIRLSGVSGDSDYCVATIGGNFNAKSETGPAVGCDPNAGWQEFKVDIMTGNYREATVVCRLGDLDIEDNQGGRSKGKAYFDNLSFEENKDVTVFRGRCVILPLYQHIIDKVGGANVVRAMVRNTEKALDGMKELTGWAPVKEDDFFPIWTPRYWSIRAGGWSGCPILVTEGFYSAKWRHALENLVSGVYVHEGGHNYNSSMWSPAAHQYTHALLMMYGVQSSGLATDDLPWTGSKPNGNVWFKRDIEAEKADGYPMGPWQYTQAVWDMGEKLGWDAVKKAFRDFHQIKHPALDTQNDKINYFLDRLSVHSGHDVRKEFFTPQQWDFFMSLHQPRPKPIQIEAVDLDQTNVFLSYIKWHEAKSRSLDRPEAKAGVSREAVFGESLTAEAPTYYIFRLNGGWRRFRGYYGLQRGVKGQVKYEIYGDDKLLWSTRTKSDSAHAFNVDVTGVQVLRLETVNLSEGYTKPKCYWFDAELLRDDQLEAMARKKQEERRKNGEGGPGTNIRRGTNRESSGHLLHN